VKYVWELSDIKLGTKVKRAASWQEYIIGWMLMDRSRLLTISQTNGDGLVVVKTESEIVEFLNSEAYIPIS
jgi:hypothetical protein